MKTIADFKRAMTIGSKWERIYRYIGNNPSVPKDLGVRKCGLNNSVGFGFINDSGLSRCSWPIKSTFSMDGKTVIITEKGLYEFRYTQINS